MTQEKTRIKLRVSAHDGVSPGGLPEPRWSEKWGVGLFDYEEFHVTDHLLKLPFQEAVPKTVCIFSMVDGALAFRLLDADRRAEVNGVQKNEAVVTTGDKIRIGDTLTIEIVLAPPIAKTKSTTRSGPVLSGITEIPPLDPEEGPTLTLAVTASSDLTPIVREPDPVFKDLRERSIEINEPSFQMDKRDTPERKVSSAIPPRPASLSSGPLPSLLPEAKVELANVPHAGRDDSLDSRSAAMAENSEEGINPVYAKEANLQGRQTLGERIFSAISRILRRDDLNPVEDPFPVGNEEIAKPWVPEGIADPGITAMKGASYGAAARKPMVEAKPWIPEAISAASRMRGRALIFLVAAVGTLMVAVGVFRIQSRVAAIEEKRRRPPEVHSEINKGFPIEVLEDQVRRLRRRR